MFSLFKKKPLLDKETQQKVEAAIQQAESGTTGEIRVYIESHCKTADPMERAREVFAALEMFKTEARNAVLVYVAIADRKFALFGDQAIYEQAGGPAFWQAAADKLTGHLRKNELGNGLADCILTLGSALAAQFPAGPGKNDNELSDEIVFGK